MQCSARPLISRHTPCVWWWRSVGTGLLAVLLSSCSSQDGAPLGDGTPPEGIASVASELSTIDCTESSDTGYSKGTPFAITVVTVDGKKVETQTANAYYVMAQAADKDGVTLKVVSGFRTQAEQQYLYNCYINCNCNNCNLAAKPGYSNHQSGHALDLNTSSSGVLNWLNANGGTFGFKRTVPSEAWHWEWWSGGPGGGPCGQLQYKGESLGISGQSYPISSQGAVTVEVGQTVTGWIKLKNVGTEVWKAGTVWMAPIPRDQPSPFASPSWQANHRISTVKSDVAPGNVGEFALDITGSQLGESLLELGWVADGITWFADGPKGGGPDDGYFSVKVNVIPGSGAGGGSAVGGSTSTGGSSAGGMAGVGNSGGWGAGEPLPKVGGASSTSADSADSDGGCALSNKDPRPVPWVLGIALAGLALSRRRRL